MNGGDSLSCCSRQKKQMDDALKAKWCCLCPRTALDREGEAGSHG